MGKTEKIASLMAYAKKIRDMMHSEASNKRKSRGDTKPYYEFLRRELDKTEKRISDLKIGDEK